MRAREFFVLGSGFRTATENGEAANREKGDALPDCLLYLIYRSGSKPDSATFLRGAVTPQNNSAGFTPTNLQVVFLVLL